MVGIFPRKIVIDRGQIIVASQSDRPDRTHDDNEKNGERYAKPLFASFLELSPHSLYQSARTASPIPNRRPALHSNEPIIFLPRARETPAPSSPLLRRRAPREDSSRTPW